MLTDPQLKSKIDSLWNKFWSGGLSNPITAIEQMSYLIFLKRLEDMDNARAAAAKRKNESYRSVFHGSKECRWSYWSQLPGDQMLKHVRDKVFDFLRELGSDTSSFTQHMQDAVFIIPKASLLQEAVKIIDPDLRRDTSPSRSLCRVPVRRASPFGGCSCRGGSWSLSVPTSSGRDLVTPQAGRTDLYEELFTNFGANAILPAGTE